MPPPLRAAVNAAASPKAASVVVWFRNDLRLHDNEVVYRAMRMCQQGRASSVLPVYVFDSRTFGVTPWGNPKTGGFRAQFQLECVSDLRSRLQAIGSDLYVAVGKPEEVLPSLNPSAVLWQQQVTHEELEVDRALQRACGSRGVGLEPVWGHTLYHLDDLPFQNTSPTPNGDYLTDFPDVFTPFRTKTEARATVRPVFPTPGQGDLPLSEEHKTFLQQQMPKLVDLPGPPQLPPRDPRAVLDFRGGETAALARLSYYLFESKRVATYFQTRNGLVGGDYSTKLAPWLAHGCVSPRHVFHELKRFEAAHEATKDTYWVVFELLCRDYFWLYALRHGRSMFWPGGPRGSKHVHERYPWQSPRTDAAAAHRFDKWKNGQTGWPFVDANMRELKATGFMSNRGRQNVSSFLVHDLTLDWRAGADWFESVLTDYDVGSNWGNWVAMAGLTGGRVNVFNITKQARDYDPEGEYVKLWCPELEHVPANKIHEPWTMSQQEQEHYECVIGKDYPAPLPSAMSKKRMGGGGGRGGRGGRGGDGKGRGGGGGGGGGGRAANNRGRRGGDRNGQARSEFERFG